MKRKNKSTLKRTKHLYAYLFIAPKFFGFLIFTLIPIAIAIIYSLTPNYHAVIHNGTLFENIQNLGLGFKNYANLFTNQIYAPSFVNAIKNTIILLLSIPLGMVIGLMVANFLCKANVKGSMVIRLLIYLPVVASAVAVNIIWRNIFDNKYGIINMLFGTKIEWLYNPSLIKLAMIIKSAWGSIGRNMIMFMSAIIGIDLSFYEASEIDGANKVQQFFKITLPMVTPIMFYLLITSIISHFQAFVDAEIFAGGAYGGQTIVYFIWQYGFNQNLYGLASAASFLLAIAIMIITVIQFKFSDNWVLEGE